MNDFPSFILVLWNCYNERLNNSSQKEHSSNCRGLFDIPIRCPSFSFNYSLLRTSKRQYLPFNRLLVSNPAWDHFVGGSSIETFRRIRTERRLSINSTKPRLTGWQCTDISRRTSLTNLAPYNRGATFLKRQITLSPYVLFVSRDAQTATTVAPASTEI